MIPSKTGGNTLVEGGMASQTTQCLINIEHVLEECGAKWSNVAKLSVFMDNFDGNGDKEKARVQFAEYNNAYLKFFEERNVPVCGRITVGAKGLALGCMIEIDGIAYLPKSKF